MLIFLEERTLRVIDYVYGSLVVLAALVVLTASLAAGTAWTDSDGKSEPAGVVLPYERPPHKALLRGTACIPLRELLLNRAIPAIHSFSRSVSCE